jgi:hypothetical protein
MNTTILSRDGKMIGSQSLMHQYHLINKKLGTKLTPTHEMPLVLRYHLLMQPGSHFVDYECRTSTRSPEQNLTRIGSNKNHIIIAGFEESTCT